MMTAQLLLDRLPWVLLGACLVWLVEPGNTPAARRLQDQVGQSCSKPAATKIHAELSDLLGIDAAVLAQIQGDLIRRLQLRRAKRSHRPDHSLITGPLTRYYESPIQDAYVRLHRLLFELKLLPLSTWGNRNFVEPMPSWLSRASVAGRGLGGTISRLGLNHFLLQYEHRVPSNATCLGIDVAQQYLPIFPGCEPRRMWSLKYEPDSPAAPRLPRLNHKKNWLTLDLTSLQSPKAAGEAHELFDLAVIQETFEHIRFPYSAAVALFHLLRPGGLVLWTAPFSTRFHLIPGDYFRYSFDGARVLFTDAGFDIEGLFKIGDTAIASGYDMGFGSADFTPEYLEQRLLQNVTQEEGKAHWACSDDQGLYISSAVAARKRSDGRRAEPLHSALRMGR